MNLVRDLHRSYGSIIAGKRRLVKVVLVLGLTLSLLIYSMIEVDNTMVHYTRRLLCAYSSMHRGGALRSLSDADCATIWPKGTGDMVPWTEKFPIINHLPRFSDPQPSTDIGSIVQYTNCPKQISTTGHSTKSTPLVDSTNIDTAAVLRHSIACSIPSASTPVTSEYPGASSDTSSSVTGNDSEFNSDSSTSKIVTTAGSASVVPTIYALIHPDAVICKGPFGEDDDGSKWDSANILGIQAHLGAFASEGLRTLVLGIRILSEQECAEWIRKYERASASLVDHHLKLTNLAVDIEKDIHIVATTAIEDKLQDGVPEPISNIGRPG